MLLEKPPVAQIKELLPDVQHKQFEALSHFMEQNYNNLKIEWRTVSKNFTYECKFIAGSKKIVYAYFKENYLGFMVIFGAKEREAFEAIRQNFTAQTNFVYDNSKTYHDGKWMLFDITDNFHLEEFFNLLPIKRKPNKKA